MRKKYYTLSIIRRGGSFKFRYTDKQKALKDAKKSLKETLAVGEEFRIIITENNGNVFVSTKGQVSQNGYLKYFTK